MKVVKEIIGALLIFLGIVIDPSVAIFAMLVGVGILCVRYSDKRW